MHKQLSLELNLDFLKPLPQEHIVCYSGGVSSALVAIEVVRRYSKNNVLLVNHDISSRTEHEDIKRFKQEVAEYLEMSITPVNIQGINNPDDIPDQFDVCVAAGGFKFGIGLEVCTRLLKTQPFTNWLTANFNPGSCTLYYGFENHEVQRIDRRAQVLKEMGYAVEFPLTMWSRTIKDTKEIGIEPPATYSTWKHANCVGCLKAGRQHWFCVYVHRPDIWEKAKWAESQVKHTILKVSLASLEPLFDAMQHQGIPATEQIPSQKFWARVRRELGSTYHELRPQP